MSDLIDRLRTATANRLESIAARISRDERSPGASRVPTSGRTLSGVVVTPDNAVQLSTVWACLRYLSQTVAVLPWHVHVQADGRTEVQRGHTVDRLLSLSPNPEWSSFQFRETLVHWAARWGNGYAEIVPDQVGRPAELWPIHPDRVTPVRSEQDEVDDYGDDIPAGALFYEVSNGTGPKGVLAAGRMFHIRGFGDGPVGVNVVAYAAQSLGWARAVQLFGASFFGNGMNVAGVVVNKKKLTTEGLIRQRKEFEQLYRGPRNANRTAFIDADAAWQPIGTAPDKAQLIEANQFLVTEISRWFGVPPHKVADLTRATFSNIESQAIEVVVDSILPWVRRLEDEANRKLFGENRRGLYSRINLNGLLRGDTKSRAEFYVQMRQAGIFSVNEIRRLEELDAIGPEGDVRVMQAQFVDLRRLAEGGKP